MARSDFDVTGEHRCQQLVQAGSDIPREPVLAASRALIHRNVEDDSDAPVALGGLGPSYGDSGGLVAAFAPYQRLLRESLDH